MFGIGTRPPRGHIGFSWGRFVLQEGRALEYRLFRRDAHNRTHAEIRRFDHQHSRREIACSLWVARIQLRERVDELSLQQLGVA